MNPASLAAMGIGMHGGGGGGGHSNNLPGCVLLVSNLNEEVCNLTFHV